jgi:hypothetical protein
MAGDAAGRIDKGHYGVGVPSRVKVTYDEECVSLGMRTALDSAVR